MVCKHALVSNMSPIEMFPETKWAGYVKQKYATSFNRLYPTDNNLMNIFTNLFWNRTRVSQETMDLLGGCQTLFGSLTRCTMNEAGWCIFHSRYYEKREGTNSEHMYKVTVTCTSSKIILTRGNRVCIQSTYNSAFSHGFLLRKTFV